MTLAGQRLGQFAQWLDASSASRLTPCAARRRDNPPRAIYGAKRKPVERWDDVMTRGRFGELLPWDFSKPFDEPYDDQALPLLVSFDQCADVALAEVADLGPPASQLRAFHRLLHIVHRVQDASDAAKAGIERFKADTFPTLALVGMDDPTEPVSAAVARAGADRLGLDAVPVVAVPLWRLARKERAGVRTVLPFIP
ncbi:MAG: hypothetical protein ACK4RZ_12010 [Paracoccaceae bacterium]